MRNYNCSLWKKLSTPNTNSNSKISSFGNTRTFLPHNNIWLFHKRMLQTPDSSSSAEVAETKERHGEAYWWWYLLILPACRLWLSGRRYWPVLGRRGCVRTIHSLTCLLWTYQDCKLIKLLIQIDEWPRGNVISHSLTSIWHHLATSDFN